MENDNRTYEEFDSKEDLLSFINEVDSEIRVGKAGEEHLKGKLQIKEH